MFLHSFAVAQPRVSWLAAVGFHNTVISTDALYEH
jgi:hypothetical protein